jgi:hypothetical protein
MTDTKNKTGPKRGCRIPRLDSVGRVGTEIAKIYRLMRNEQIKSIDGLRAAQCLLALKNCLEVGEIADRLANIEQALANREARKPQIRDQIKLVANDGQ